MPPTQLFVKLEDNRGSWVPRLYSVLMALTILFEVTAVFISTATGVRLSGGGFDPMATDGVSLLTREFEFAFICTRFQFFTGLMTSTHDLCERRERSWVCERGLPSRATWATRSPSCCSAAC